MQIYSGNYYTFECISKEDSVCLISSDSIIGDFLTIKPGFKDSNPYCSIINKFGTTIGYLNSKDSRNILYLVAEDLTINAILSLVYFKENNDNGNYYGEIALLAYQPAYSDIFSRFVDNISKRISSGIRPDINLSNEGVKNILDSEGNWSPSKNIDFPKDKTIAIIKRRKSIFDNVIEAGRNKNIGCYIVSWLFILILVIIILIFLNSLFNIF